MPAMADVVAGHTEMASGQVTAANNAQKTEKGRSCCTHQKKPLPAHLHAFEEAGLPDIA